MVPNYGIYLKLLLYFLEKVNTNGTFNIPQRTHCVCLPLICQCLPLAIQLEMRLGLDSDSDTFCFLTRQSSANPYSTIGKNVKNIMYKYHIPPHTMFGGNYASVAKLINKMYENDVDEIDRAHASVLSECIEMRDRTFQCNSLSYEEANDVIDWTAIS